MPTHSSALLPFSLEGRFKIVSRIFLNSVTCSCLVKKSASMLPIGQYATLTSNFFIFSVTKVHLTLKCHDHLLLDSLLFLDESFVWLSRYIIVVGMCPPWTARKCLVHSTCPMASSIATSSASVELLAFYNRHQYTSVAFDIWRMVYELSTLHCGLLFASIVNVMSWLALILYYPFQFLVVILVWVFYSCT